jgi:4-hydroxythreonine-4-phosphate dehydrogenase
MTSSGRSDCQFDIRHSTLGITMGDPAGIGPEILLKALAAMPRLRPVIFGSRAVLEREQRRLRTSADLSLVDDSVPNPGRFRMGRAQKNCGTAAFAALEAGVAALKQGSISALVTAPVSKEALRLAGFRWPGQTEFLADRLGARRHAMLAWTPRFKAVFVTIHQPLGHVSRHITPDNVADKALLLDSFLRAELGRRPRICALAFNPHGHEFSLGEESWIASGVAIARKSGVDAVGPVPADAALASLARAPHSAFDIRHSSLPCDGFVAMYHDQAMIPAKLLARGQGVNVTLGLGRIRTSPLHGTAFDIAGKGIADPRSMLAAIRLALRLAR